jgi:perosamine synthetase
MDWNGIKVDHPNSVWCIDDCAQALGAKGIGKADITCFSFEDKKHITSGSEGGMITTNNAELATRARKFCGLGYKHMTAEAGRTSLAQSTYQDPSYERFDTIGLNYRMSQIQAAVGLGQLERLDHIVARRKAVAAMFLSHDGKPNHSYYTLPIKNNIDWKETYNKFVGIGGHGFYAMPQLAPNEPAIKQWIAPAQYAVNAWPIANELQKKLMLMKTNYRDLGEARQQADIFHRLTAEWF